MSQQDLLIPGQKNLANQPDFAQQEEGQSSLLGDLGGAGYTRLTFKGNRFRVIHGEEETVLEENKLPVIMLDAFPKVSRIYYEGSYDGETKERPKCASADGEVPLPHIEEPQSDKCQMCPQNQKGSAISDDGGKRRACGFFKRACFLLVDYPDLGPVVSDLKALSMFGESYPDSGHLNLRAYADKLDKHRTKPEALITELSFDSNSSVPKILFRATSYVEEDFYFETIKPILDEAITAAMVDTTQIRCGEDGDNPPAAPAGGGFRDKMLENKPAHAEAGEEGDGEGEETAPSKPATTKKKVAKKKTTKKKVAKKVAAKPKPEPEPEPEFEEDDEEFDAELEAALAEWEDD